MIRKIFALLAVLAGLNVAQAANVATRNVDGATKNYPSVKAAIKAADPSETITIIASCENDFGATNITFSVNSGYTLTLKGGDYSECTFMGDGTTSIIGGTYDFDPSSWVADGYSATKSGDIWTVAEASGHEHQWKYDDGTQGELTATCTNLNGTCVLSGQSFTLSITCAGKSYDGKPVTATVTKNAFEDATGLTVGKIVYKRTGATLDAAPSDAGDYTAEVTAGDYTISVAFTIAPIDITGATVTLDVTRFDFDGTVKSVNVTSVELSGGKTLTAVSDYTVDPSTTSATGSGVTNDTYTVIVAGRGNYTGEATATWTVVAGKPAGSFNFGTGTSDGEYGTVADKTLTVTESTKLAYNDDGTWSMSMTVTMPSDGGFEVAGYDIRPNYIPASKLYFKHSANEGILIASDEDACAEYGLQCETETTLWGDSQIKSFTWTEKISLSDVEAAIKDGDEKLVRTVKVWSPKWSDSARFIRTFDVGNHDGLPVTEYRMEVPLEGLVLIDSEGNQAYPDAGYVAENGTTHKKYLTLAAALADAAGQTVEVFADAAAEGELIVPVGATLNLGSHGHAESTYVLTGTELDFSAKVISTKEETVSARGEGVADDFFKAVKADDSCTYTLELRHKHIFGYEPDDETDTITVTCSDEGECAYKTTPSVATLKADSLVYTGEAYVGARAEKSDNFPAEVTLTYFKNETPLGDALAGAPTDAGEYVVRMSAGGQSVEKTFTIVQAQLSALNLKTAVFSYDGTEKTAEIESVKAGENGAFTLKPEDYEVSSGDALTQVGSLAETKSYSVVVTAKAGGNYTGSVQMNWKIEAPSGEAGAVAATIADVGTLTGTAYEVAESRKLAYDPATQTWSAGLRISVPYTRYSFELIGLKYTPPVYMDEAHLIISSPEEVKVETKTEGIKIEAIGLDWSLTYVDSLIWTPLFSIADVLAAKEAGKDALEFGLTVAGLAWQYNAAGIQATTYTIRVPVDEALVLLDEDQNQVYPHIDFVAQVGKTKYASLDAALAAAAETANVSKTNVVTAIGTVTNGSYAVGKYVKLELGAYGADSTYVLGADAVLTADAALANVSAASGSELMSAGDSPVTYWTIKAHEHVYGHTAQGAVLTEFCTAQLKDGSPCGVTNLCTLGDASKAYDGEAPSATVADKLDAKHTTGKVLYLNTDRSKVSVWNVGTYLSVVTVSVNSVGYELSREFTISPADLKDATVTLSATELAYDGKVQTVSVRSVKIGDLTLTKDTHYTVEGTLAETGLFNGTQEYAVTVTAVAGGNFTGSKTVTWKIVSKPRDFGAVTKNNAADNASYDEKSRTLTVSDGTGWTYYTADKAPDGSGIEGWYAGLKVSWPSDINIDLSGFKLLYTRPEAARFTVNAIKTGGGEEKRIFNGTNSIPGVMVNTLPIDLSAIVQGLDLTCVTSFTWWERLTIADLEAAKSAGRKTIERTVTAWGEVWSDTFKAGLIFQTEREYGDPDGVRPTTYKLVANLEGLTLYDSEGLAWPQHEHKWEYVANDTSVTATCAIAGCRYEKSPAGVTLSADPAERLCNGLPLAATLANAETFRGVTKSEVSGILYTGTDYTGAAYESAEAPVQPGNYRAEAAVTLADGTTYEIGLALTIREGLVVVDGQHYESPAEVLEMPGSDLVKVSVWKDFKAEKTYVMPANGTKVLDLCGKTISVPDGQENVITNLGALTIIDSAVTPQEAAKGTYRGKLYGDIVNTGTLTITGGYIAGTIVNAGGTVLLSGGVFKVRPDAKWLADGCKIVTRSGLYYVEGHLHQYVLVRSLGGSLVFATCMNILADGTLQASECDAREVIFLLSPMQGLLAGAVSVPTTSLEYDGRPKGVELTAFNLWALRELIRMPSLADLGETWELIQKVIKLTQGGGSITDGAEVLTEILEALAERGFNPADFVLSADKVAALTGIEAGTVAYTCGGEPVEGVPVNAGTYRATMTLTGGDGRSQTIVSTYTINPTDIAAANPNITCDPKRRTFQYDQEEKVISVKSVALDSPATVQIRKFLAAAQEFMSEPDWNGAMNLLSMLNELAVDLPQPPDFWKDYGILKALDFVADFMTYLTTDVIEYLQYEITAVTLVEGVDYTVGGTTNATDIGAYVLTVDGAGNYKGTIPVDWTITYDHDGVGHNWSYTLDGAKLTATCGTHPDDCLISPAVIELVPDTVAEKAYDGVPLTASLSNAFLFATYTGATNIGAVVYRDADGAALASAPVAVGEYWATADVVAAAESGGSTNTLKLALTITIPEGGFTDGYEVRASGAEYGVRHDTLAQALAAAKTGDTIFAHDGITGKDLDFTTDADVTIDLCGKTLTASPTSTLLGNNDMTLANAGAGTVTFVNGTIRQPLHYILGQQNADQLTIASGTFVFGEKLATANVATSQVNFFTVTVADGASLAIADGKHDAKFAGEVEVTGGSFWSNFDPTPFLPEGRITRPDPEDATRTVIVEHWHNVVATAEGDTISMFCRTEGDCDLKTPATVTLSVAAEIVYNGQPVEATVTKAGNPVYTLAYFTDEDPRVALGGAPTASGAYVAVLSMGEASVEKRFAIVPAETRPFGAVTSAVEGVGKLEGNVLTVTDSLKLDYEPADGTWAAGLAIAVPHQRWSTTTTATFPYLAYVPPVYTDAAHFNVSAPEHVEVQTKTEGVKVDLLRLDWSYEYINAVLWMPRFTAEDVQRAIEAGQEALTFELTLSADVWEYDINGLTETTYTIVVPLANLVLNDERGVQIYPEHDHDWAFSSEGGVLTATCRTADCPQGTLTLVLAAADKVFDHRPLEATLTGADAFVLHTGATVGEIVYFDAEGRTLAAAPSLVGEYRVSVDVVAAAEDGGSTNTLKLAFAITVPEGGFTDGYEVNGVCYDTFAAALAAAGEGDTLYLREPLGNQALFDFTSDKNVTIDLCGQTLTYERSQAAASDLTIQNVSTGVVTLVNGTIQQPRGQSRQSLISPWQNVYYNVDVTGPFVFGEGLETEKRGTVFTVTANALAIAGGAYESAFAGELVITGGTFASDPGEFVPAGYMTVEDEGVWVVINHTHAYAYAAEGQTIVRTCVGGKDPCPDAPVSLALSVAAATAYTGNPVAATVTPSDAFDHALAYFADGEPLDGAPADAGEYAVVMTAGGAAVTNFFAITPVALTSLALAEGAFVCDGTPKTNAVADVRAGSFTLTADDYTVAGDALIQTGSIFSTETYTVIVHGTGNFTGAATNTWAILASSEAFEAWRNLYCRLDLADFGLDVPLNAKAVKAEGLPAGLKLVKTAVKDEKGKKTAGYRYAIEGVPTELMDNETRPAYVRITDAAGVQTLWPLVLRVSEPEPGADVEGTVGSSTLVIGANSNVALHVTKIWREAAINWTYKGWPSGVTYDKDTGYFRGKPKKAGRYTLTATSGKVGSTTYKNVRTATFTVWADADGELSELTGQAYVALTNGMDRFGAVKSVTGLPTGLKFTAKGVTDKTYGAIPSNTVYGLPTKAGTFAVTLTLADKSKKSILWTIAPAVAPTCEVVLGDAADTPVERRRAQLVRGSARRYEIATSDPKAAVTVSGLPSGLTLKKTAVKDAAGKAVGYTYALEGVPTAVGEFFVTVKTTLNGVTTVSSLAFTVNENPFTGLYKGLTALDGRIGAAELSVAAGGTVKLTLKEGKTTYTANVKSFEWNGTNESGRAVFLLKATSADKKAGFPDREIEALMLSDGTATVCDILSPVETCELFRTVKPTAEEMPSFTATYRFAKESGGPLAVIAVVYDAKRATASVKGKLADGTSVSMASIAVLSNGFLAPVQAVDKSGMPWVFDRLGFEGPAAVGSMSWMGEEGVVTVTTYGSDVTANPKPKFGEVVTEETTLDLMFEDAEEPFRLVPNGKGGVAVYEAGTANPLLTVSSAFANGLLSFSFTSKTGDKAKYAVDLVLEAESLPSGQVLRTWKDGSTSLSSAGVVLLTVQP